jgi:hypothetical protein
MIPQGSSQVNSVLEGSGSDGRWQAPKKIDPGHYVIPDFNEGVLANPAIYVGVN